MVSVYLTFVKSVFSRFFDILSCYTPITQCPLDVGLFGLDVTTDYVNGANLINNGDTIWGAILVTLPFLPMALVGFALLLYVMVEEIDDDPRLVRCSKRLLAVVLYVPGVILSTALYMLFVLTAGFAKVLNPEIESQPDRELFLGIDGDDIARYPALLRMGEVVGESYPQAAIGNF